MATGPASGVLRVRCRIDLTCESMYDRAAISGQRCGMLEDGAAIILPRFCPPGVLLHRMRICRPIPPASTGSVFTPAAVTLCWMS